MSKDKGSLSIDKPVNLGNTSSEYNTEIRYNSHILVINFDKNSYHVKQSLLEMVIQIIRLKDTYYTCLFLVYIYTTAVRR